MMVIGEERKASENEDYEIIAANLDYLMESMDVDSLEVKRVVHEYLIESMDVDSLEDVHTAEKMLTMLANLKFSQDDRISILVPELFRCFLSKRLMSEPMVISTGERLEAPHHFVGIKDENKERVVTDGVVKAVIEKCVAIRCALANFKVSNGDQISIVVPKWF
ncbi:hypothetical protein SASPL_122072 [Salvia splendens]|uniref:Uncharacterized protein n=1 Tax=Salvia splendens TaxID=180675 RepID=A0A8X8XLG0_SALSN|nr:hypothetical protein SASPL_122072 [Salvia splendens]